MRLQEPPPPSLQSKASSSALKRPCWQATSPASALAPGRAALSCELTAGARSPLRPRRVPRTASGLCVHSG
eukprot:6188521-Pleurochrysis_carterae.AAC.2